MIHEMRLVTTQTSRTMARPRRFAPDRTKGSIASWNNLCCYIAKFHIAFVFYGIEAWELT